MFVSVTTTLAHGISTDSTSYPSAQDQLYATFADLGVVTRFELHCCRQQEMKNNVF